MFGGIDPTIQNRQSKIQNGWGLGLCCDRIVIVLNANGGSTMMPANWEESDSATAKQIWIDYQRQHDLSARIGQTAGIDPRSGRIWFGLSVRDIVSQRDAEGLHSPLYFERVGSDAYLHKGTRW